jgi:predicted PurR-regulated permease PerM
MATIGPALDVPEGRPNRRFIAVATLVGVAVILCVAALLIGLWLVRETIVWLVAAGFLAFSIEPLIRIFTRRGLSRGWATGAAFLVITAVILFFAIALLPAIANASRFFTGSGKLLDLVGGLASAGFAVFMIFTFTLYFLVYGRDLLKGLTGLMPFTYRAPFLDAARRIYKMNTGYWYGKFLIGVIAGLTTFVTMKLLGLPYAAALSLFVGITDLIPNIGATLGTIPVVIVGLLEEPWKGVVAGVVLILYQQLENNLITPKVFKETVEIHPFLSVVTVIVFTSLFGIVGALIAVPVTKAIEMLIGAWREGRTPTLEPPLPEPGDTALP